MNIVEHKNIMHVIAIEQIIREQFPSISLNFSFFIILELTNVD